MIHLFVFNNVLVKLVPWHGQDTHPNGNAFYISRDGSYGVRVYPDGHKVLVNPAMQKTRGDGTKQEYLHFNHAWGHQIGIYVSRAVYSAWVGPIPEGMTIDHINGVTTDNRFENLRTVSPEINSRDGGFLRKLRNKGIKPECIFRPFLLRYFDRMAKFKAGHTPWQYRKLTQNDLKHLLYDNDDC